MPAKKYIIKRKADEHAQLLELTGRDEIGARIIKRALIFSKLPKGEKTKRESRFWIPVAPLLSV